MYNFRMSKRRYITTAIDYPNAAPHMGHVLEKILADAAARAMRLQGDDVHFQIGTDEHGVKIQQTAKAAGVTPEELVDRNVPLFEELYARVGISADAFIRTSGRPVVWKNRFPIDHRRTVEALWRKLREAGTLEQRTYEGLYCTGCERFITEKDLVDGKCPTHQKAPEKVSETNWFFLLSKDAAWLKKILTDGTYTITPTFRAPETLTLIDGGLEDVSFSRPKKSLSWGIPVPDDPEQTMYVWCDALTNYVSGVGMFVDPKLAKEWWNDAEVTHVIGKDIARFHALIWPAMLKAAGVRTPDRLLIHGFITSEGQKMSKSLGNVVLPAEPIEKIKQGVLGNPKNATLNLTETDAERMGIDALRFYLLHEIPVGNDGDFSWTHYSGMYDGVLRNQFGNLLNRVIVLLNKGGGMLAFGGASEEQQKVAEQWAKWEKHLADFELHAALQDATELVRVLNLSMEQRKPWSLTGDEKIHILSMFAECLRHLSLMLLPFLPQTAYEICRQLGVPYADTMLAKDFALTGAMKTWGGTMNWAKVGEPRILFAAYA